jgi:capsular exopolysaccharide synthesis family protein
VQLFQSQVDLAAVQPKIESLRQRVHQYSAQAAAQPALDTQLGRLLRDRDVMQRVYIMLLEREKEVEISSAGTQGEAKVVDHAVVDPTPCRPARQKMVILGLILGCSTAFLIEYMDNSVRTWEDIRDQVGLPVLGAIPLAETQPSLVWQEGSRSLAAEAYRMLRSNVSFVSVDAPVRTIMVTSAGPGEGKSSTVSNLAAAMAHDGKRVVIVDADMRKPSQFRLIGGGRHIGLAEVLSGINTVDEAVRESEVPGVFTIPVDKLPPNPAELLNSQRMRDLVARLQDTFDIVMIDTPPCLVVTDAAVLAALADATILVVAAGKTTRDAVIRARDTLLSAHGRLVGTVLNRFHADDAGSYYYYYYYYYGDDEKGSHKSKRPKLPARN